jgi:3-dehydroquinate dehydratase-1
LYTDRKHLGYMKIVAALTDPAQASAAHLQGADLLEIRLDLAGGDPVQQVRRCRELSPLPVIATLRSGQEGGRYFGDADAWITRILPVLPFADYIDVEQRFSVHAQKIRAAGKKIIASHHSLQMLPLPAFFELERELRQYGDIPKIVVTPRSDDDLVELISFTCAADKPVCTGVMGAQFRHARAILPLFGSEFAYCHTGTPTAEGQYSVEEFAVLMSMLGAGHGVHR